MCVCVSQPKIKDRSSQNPNEIYNGELLFSFWVLRRKKKIALANHLVGFFTSATSELTLLTRPGELTVCY